jgi:hypothetical protein
MCCARNRGSAPKALLSRVCNKFAVALVCGAMALIAQPVFAQRGGSWHMGGGGHWSGGGHTSGARSSAGSYSGGSWTQTEPRGGIESRSREEPRDGSEQSRSSVPESGKSWAMPSSSTRLPSGPGGSAKAVRSGRASSETASPPAPRHTTIGFPRDSSGAWRGTPSGNVSEPLRFAGQGDALWQTSAERATSPTANHKQSPNTSSTGQWEIRIGRSDRHKLFGRDDIFRRRFRGHSFFGSGFGFYGFPFVGYGVGLYAYCPAWLDPNWDWQEDLSTACEDLQQQDNSIVAYGADQNDGVSLSDTRQFYGENAWQSGSGAGANSSASGGAESGAIGESRAEATRAPDTLIYLADGTNYSVTSYWLAGGALHYVTSYGGGNAIPIGQIDLQRTVDANAAQGIQFTLRPAPLTNPQDAR